MKKFSFFLFFVFTSPFLFAQKRPQQLPDREKIIHVLKNQEQAWNRGNIDEYMSGYWQSDSLIFIGKKDVNRGWQLTLMNYKAAYPTKAAMGTLKFDIISVDVLSKSAAHVIGKWTLKKSAKDIIVGHFTLLFKKIDSRWMIVCDHTS